jgi:hypothetical protein
MLEACVNQAAGLQALSAQPAPRIVAMASHGDRVSELPVLCNLCAAWSDFGYPVAVLDATMTESDITPGLLQLLELSGHPAEADRGPAAWPIFPAALGLAHLCRATQEHGSSSGESLSHLGNLFANYEIVLVYASAQDLATYLPDSGIEPLLTVSAKGMSVLSAYQSLKQLLINGRLQPTIVAVMDESNPTNMVASRSMGKSLQDCARAFLSHHVQSLAVLALPDKNQPFDDMHWLALRLLEGAVSLRQSNPSLATTRQKNIVASDGFARSH